MQQQVHLPRALHLLCHVIVVVVVVGSSSLGMAFSIPRTRTSFGSAPTRPSPPLWSTPDEQARFIEYQVEKSSSASLSSASSSRSTRNDPKDDDESLLLTPEQRHLQHQQRVFDSMSPWFAPDRDNEVTPELVPVYRTMAKTILTQLVEERNKNTKNNILPPLDASSPTTTTTTTTPMTFRILDVACGTGVLWDFLLEEAAAVATTLDPAGPLSLDIVGVDLSPAMVDAATQRAQNLLSLHSHNNHHNNNHNHNPHQHSIQVIVGDIVQYCQQQQQQQPVSYDGILLNACFGNFYDPGQVLASLPYSNTTTTTTTTTIFVSHPLGAAFVQNLHQNDPQTVPHTLPLSTLEMVQQWTFGRPGLVPIQLHPSTTPAPDTDSNPANPKDHYSYYLMTLKRLARATPLPSLQRYRGIVDTGYGRGGKKLGVPTANLPSRLFQDALTNVEPGVYFGWAALEHLLGSPTNRWPYPAVVNVGYSPTFEGEENKEKIIEAHLIVEEDGNGLEDFYGQVMRLELSGFLRPEKKFDSFPALLAQIRADIVEAQAALGGSPYVELRDRSELFVRQTNEGASSTTSWIGSSGGDDIASWEFVDHREVLAKVYDE